MEQDAKKSKKKVRPCKLFEATVEFGVTRGRCDVADTLRDQ